MKFVLAPRYLHRSLLSILRKDNPFEDIKLVSKEELMKYCFQSVKSEAVIYLMKKYGYTYEVANTYLEFVIYSQDRSDNPKIKHLYEIKKELLENDLIVEPLENCIYQSQEFDVFNYYENDVELSDIFKHLNITPTYHMNTLNKEDKTLLEFDKVEEETYHVLNKIASLIDSGVNINDIYIFKRNEVYDYYLNKFSSLFGFKINIRDDTKFISLGISKRFFQIYKESQNIEDSLILLKEESKEEPLFEDLKELIKNNLIEDVNFDIQYDYLVNKFAEKNLPFDRYDNAVNVNNSPLFLEGKHIFVMGFVQGQFPKSYKDDKLLNNEELSALNRLNAKDKTKIDEKILLDFLSSKNTFYYSYSKKSIKEKYFPSPLSTVLNLKIDHEKLDYVFYSEDTLKYIYTNLLDMERFYKEKGEDLYKCRGVVAVTYNCYDSSFKYEGKIYNENDKIILSTSSLELYNNCPYHYYLSKVLKLDEDEPTFYQYLGEIAHYIFEHCRDEKFDFEIEFAEKIKEFPMKTSDLKLLNGKLKSQIKLAVEAIRKRDQFIKNPRFYNEITLTAKLDDNTKVTGRIDSLITINNQYFICIDYKTGSSKINDAHFEYGLSTQLPTYVLLTQEDERFKDYQVVGIYINNVISKSLTDKVEEGELIPKYLKLNGKTLAELGIVSDIDSTIGDGKSSFINDVNLKKDNTFVSRGSGLISSEEFSSYSNRVREFFLKAASNIRNNNFDISPIYFSDSDHACLYCPYKDICHVKGEQRRIIEKEENENE